MINKVKTIIKSLLNTPYALINYVNFKLKHVEFSSYKTYGFLRIINRGKITIGKGFKARSGKMTNPIGGDTILRLICRKDAYLKFGDYVGISNSTIVCHNKVTIGNHVYIGGSCKIWDTDFHSLDPIVRHHRGDKQVKVSPVLIEDYAFIGSGSIILKGVHIGKNSIIGAGSVVTKNVPKNQIWAGNPAKFIRELD